MLNISRESYRPIDNHLLLMKIKFKELKNICVQGCLHCLVKEVTTEPQQCDLNCATCLKMGKILIVPSWCLQTYSPTYFIALIDHTYIEPNHHLESTKSTSVSIAMQHFLNNFYNTFMVAQFLSGFQAALLTIMNKLNKGTTTVVSRK